MIQQISLISWILSPEYCDYVSARILLR